MARLGGRFRDGLLLVGVQSRGSGHQGGAGFRCELRMAGRRGRRREIEDHVRCLEHGFGVPLHGKSQSSDAGKLTDVEADGLVVPALATADDGTSLVSGDLPQQHLPHASRTAGNSDLDLVRRFGGHCPHSPRRVGADTLPARQRRANEGNSRENRGEIVVLRDRRREVLAYSVRSSHMSLTLDRKLSDSGLVFSLPPLSNSRSRSFWREVRLRGVSTVDWI